MTLPAKPNFHAMTSIERADAFGKFKFVAAPVKGNPENISIQGAWARENLVVIELQEIVGIAGAPAGGRIQCHRLMADPLRYMFEEFEQRGLLDLVHTWDGCFCPRFIRGSHTSLSNHSWGTAFDINANWNPYGKAPAAAGKLGCVYELVPIANKHGFYWGGHFLNRPDGMHFEYARLPKK
jgi:hypothetical protein